VALASNIDATGRRIRLIAGIVLTLFACLTLLAGALPRGSTPLAIVGGLALAAGAFLIFEARAGWCAVRALGFKTPR
jgi:hypothetical protein